METKFTPRPWQQNGSALYSADPQRELICVVYGVGVSGLLIDNLRLIAAAPELYEAANEARELLLGGYTTKEGYEFLEADVIAALDKLKSALAKAVTNA